jgi:sigma-B regulation protein RsbU (phosphoserine phosphatase)
MTTPAILVVDDSATARRAMVQSLQQIGYSQILQACSGEEALDILSRSSVDLVILDIEMPGMNGMAVLWVMKRDPQFKEIPVIVLSGAQELETAATCIEAGAEDYLNKPYNPIILRARIESSLEKKKLRDLDRIRLIEIQREKELLEITQSRLSKELDDAARYVRSILPAPIKTTTHAIDWHYEPTGELAGDSFGYHQIDNDHLAIYLLDVCGHGVGAALLSVSVINAIRTSSINGIDFYDPASVLEGLNATFPMERNNDMYFSIWYGVYHLPTQTLRHASAGHPPALLLLPDEGIEEINEPGPITGLMPFSRYRSSLVLIPSGAHLLVLCDGTYEVNKADGALLDFEEFKLFVDQNCRSENAFGKLLDWIRSMNGPGPLDDDFSIIRVHFP